MGPAAQQVPGVLCVWRASLVTTLSARSARVSRSGWKQVISFVFLPDIELGQDETAGLVQGGK